MNIPSLTEQKFQKLALKLARIGRTRPEIGETDIDRVLRNLIGRSLLCLPLLADNRPLLDLGGGVGIPGLPLALARDELTVLSVEPRSSCQGIVRWLLKDLPNEINFQPVESRLEEFDPPPPPLQATSRAALSWPHLIEHLPETTEPIIRWSAPDKTPELAVPRKYLLRITVSHFDLQQVFTWLGSPELFHVKQNDWQEESAIEIDLLQEPA